MMPPSAAFVLTTHPPIVIPVPTMINASAIQMTIAELASGHHLRKSMQHTADDFLGGIVLPPTLPNFVTPLLGVRLYRAQYG